MNNLIIILIVLLCFQESIFSQPAPDSLVGCYAGIYYFKYDSSPIWTTTPDTFKVFLVNSTNCTFSGSGAVGVFGSGFETNNYGYCDGNSYNWLKRFYGNDSLMIIYNHISQPPPNYALQSRQFYGKKILTNCDLSVSIQENNIDQTFNVYPNPTNGELHIQTKKTTGKVAIKLFDVMGKTAYTTTVLANNEQVVTINTTNFAKGVYFLLVEDEKNSMVKKVVVQ